MTQEERIVKLLAGSAFIRPRDIIKHGLPRTALMRLARKGRIIRVERGLYMLPGGPDTEHFSLLEVAKRVPDAVICLLTALRFHGLGTQEPYQVWIAIDRKSKKPRIGSTLVRIARFSGASLSYGIEEHDIHGTVLKVTSPAKTVADCFKYRNKVGLDVALEALKDGFHSRKFSPEELYQAAQVCRVWKVVKPYAEALV